MIAGLRCSPRAASFFTWNAHPVATKAETELGWTSTPLAEGLRRTLDALEI